MRLLVTQSAVAVAVLLAAASPCSALLIDLHFNSSESDNPASDPAATNLQNIMLAAADYWEGIIKDSHGLRINYWWEDLDNNWIGLHSNVSTSGGRETECNIRFDTPTAWYYDATPTDHSEYGLGQTLYRDLTAAQQMGWFTGSTPEVMEAGFRGTATAGAPWEAINNHDLFTVALHEIGHALGMTSSVASGQVGDQDYDVNTTLVGGATMAVDCFDAGDVYHLADERALMYPGTGAGWRILPSAADVFSMASASSWTTLDLPRKDFLGGTDWHTASNWLGGRVPDGADAVSIRLEGSLVNLDLSAHAFADTLLITEDAYVWTNAYTLQANSELTLDGTSAHVGETTRLIVSSGGRLVTNGPLHVLNTAHLQLSGGDVIAYDGDVDVDSDSIIEGNGLIRVNQTLQNDGLIRVNSGDLTLEAAGSGGYDLCGPSRDGEVEVTGGDLIVDAPMADTFGGTMTIGTTRTAEFNQGLVVSAGGAVNLGGTLSGSDIEINGWVDVTSSTAEISGSQIDFNDTNALMDAGEKLTVTGPTQYFNVSSFGGAGTLVQHGNVRAVGNSSIVVDVFDWDGTGANVTTIVNGSALTIVADQIDTSASSLDGYDGTITMESGELTVTTTFPWRLDGTLHFNDAGWGGPALDGSDVLVYGSIDADGSATIRSNVTFGSPASVALPTAGDSLTIEGDTVYEGGSYTGAGKLAHDGDLWVVLDTTISTDQFDWDGPSEAANITTIDPGARLIINSDSIDAAGGYDGSLAIDTGTLTVNTVGAWEMHGPVALVNSGGGTPTITGSQMRVYDALTVAGTATVFAPVDFRSTASVSVANSGDWLSLLGGVTYRGGSYTGLGRIVQTSDATVYEPTTIDVAVYDWDGAGEDSTTTITSGDSLTLNTTRIDAGDPTSDGFDGTVYVDGGTLTVNTPNAWRMEGAMVLTSAGGGVGSVDGSKMVVTGSLESLGYDCRVNAISIIESTATVSATSGGAQLKFVGPTTLKGGTYTGDGKVFMQGDTSVAADTTIGAGLAVFDWDGDAGSKMTVEPNVMFTINAPNIDAGGGGYDGETQVLHDARLTVNTPAPWDLEGTILLNNAKLDGSAVNVYGQIEGYGAVTGAGLVNHGSIAAQGGTLEIDTIAFPNLDADPAAGVYATSGSIQIATNPGAEEDFNAQLYVGSGHTFEMDHYGLRNLGTITLRGGTYRAPTFTQDGKLVVEVNDSTLDSDAVLASYSTTTLDAHLHIAGRLLLDEKPYVEGTGRLIVDNGAILGTLANGALVDVTINNFGTVRPGASIGVIEAAGFHQQATGTLEMQIAGTASSQYDRIYTNGLVLLGGALDVDLFGGFKPTLGDRFDLLDWGTIVPGYEFATLDLPILDSSLTWDISALYTMGVISVGPTLLGDYNLDGVVDAADYTVWRDSLGDAVDPYVGADGSGNGMVDEADFAVWKTHYGNTAGSGTGSLAATTAVPEPTAIAMCLVALCFLVGMLRGPSFNAS